MQNRIPFYLFQINYDSKRFVITVDVRIVMEHQSHPLRSTQSVTQRDGVRIFDFSNLADQNN